MVHRHVAVAMLVVGSAAATVGGSPSFAAADRHVLVGDRTLGVHIVEQSFGVDAATPFTAEIELSGTSAELTELTDAIHADPPADDAASPSDPVAEVRVRAYDAVSTADQLTGLDRDGPGDPVASVSFPAGDIFTDVDSNTGSISVPVGDTTDDALALDRPGIYPLTIDVLVDGDAVTTSVTTFVELLDPDATVDTQPLAVSIMAGVSDPGPWPSPTELTSGSIEVAKLIELAEAVDGPLSISLPSGLVTALTADGDDGAATTTEAPDTAASATTDAADATVLAGAPGSTDPAFAGLGSGDAIRDAFRADELLAIPAIALDPSSLTAVDQIRVFTEQLRAGEDVLSTASPRAVVSRAVWFSRGPVSAAAMVALRDLGIRMLVVPDDTANELGVSTGSNDTGMFAVNLVADGSLPAITFSDLGGQLQTPVDGESTATPNELAVRLLVELQLRRASTGTPAVVLATPRVTVPDPAITAQFVELANGMPNISVVPISRLPGIVDGALVGGPATPVALPAAAGVDLSERLARVAEARIDATHATRMLVEPERGELWDSDLTRVLSTAVDDATAFEHLAEAQQEIDRVLGAIVPPDSDTLRLTGTSSTLRLRLENTYDQPLNVVVHVRSPKLSFPNPDPLVTIAAGESTLVDIPVVARSNGTFTIEVDVLAPDRARLADPIVLKARVTRLTGLSQVVTGAAALVLVSWWYSHIRRSRRRRIGATGVDAPDDGLLLAVSPDAAEAMVQPRPAALEPHPESGAESGPASDPG